MDGTAAHPGKNFSKDDISRAAALAASGDDASRVAFRVYQDPAIYAAELERVFYGPTWNYVGLAAEVPNVGDWRRNMIGEREVLLVRKSETEFSVLPNVCAHRGAQICQALKGNTEKAFMCPYHQWTYDHDGKLIGVPFRRGVKGNGGMPADFELSDYNLPALRVAEINGVIFASYDAATPPLDDYLGDDMKHYFTRVFDGRKLRIVGHHRQMIDCNWKLQMENLKDPYHAGLLHLFLVTFGLFRLDQKSATVLDDTGGHSALTARRSSPDEHVGNDEIASYTPDYALEDPTLLEPVMEFDDEMTLAIQTVFPSIIVQAQSNTLATRHVIPKGVGRHELIWTFFGYEDDDAARHELRLRQANLMGPAGYVTLDDAEALEISQRGVDSAPPDNEAVLVLDGDNIGSTNHLVTEAPIRGFHKQYRDLMGREIANAL